MLKKLMWAIVILVIVWITSAILHWDFFLTLTGIVLLGALSWTIGGTFFEAHERATSHRRHYRDDDDYELDED